MCLLSVQFSGETETEVATQCDAFFIEFYGRHIFGRCLDLVDRNINLIDKFTLTIDNIRSIFAGISWVSDKQIETETGEMYKILTKICFFLLGWRAWRA